MTSHQFEALTRDEADARGDYGSDAIGPCPSLEGGGAYNEGQPSSALKTPAATDAVASRHRFWLQHESQKNFGDYLSELILQDLVLAPEVEADVYRLIGSTIHDGIVWADLSAVGRPDDGVVLFWCCGLRDETGLSPSSLQHCQFYGARGPLTRDHLGLPADCAIGDPGFLAPLLVDRPARKSGRTICVPHIHDRQSDEEIRKVAGVDKVIRPTVRDLDELRSILSEIASADFVVAGSLHAAIVACAFDIPFACWDDGHLDLPFKWRDFAASIDTPLIFVRTLAEGKQAYHEVMSPTLRKPKLASILSAAPFQVRPSAMLRAAALDLGVAVPNDVLPALRAMEPTRSESLIKYANAKQHLEARVAAQLNQRHAQIIEEFNVVKSREWELLGQRHTELTEEVNAIKARERELLGQMHAEFTEEVNAVKARERELWSHLQVRIDRQQVMEQELQALRAQALKARRPLETALKRTKKRWRKFIVRSPLPESFKKRARAKLERDAARSV